jgi:hypothetical protein
LAAQVGQHLRDQPLVLAHPRRGLLDGVLLPAVQLVAEAAQQRCQDLDDLRGCQLRHGTPWPAQRSSRPRWLVGQQVWRPPFGSSGVTLPMRQRTNSAAA